MPQPKTEFDATDGDILIELYDCPDVTLSSHTLTQRLNPNVQATDPVYRIAFSHVSSAIEEHIVRELIRGKRLRDGDGIFFDNLKLTSKGEQAAIQERKRRELPGKVKRILDVVAAIRERDQGVKS